MYLNNRGATSAARRAAVAALSKAECSTVHGKVKHPDYWEAAVNAAEDYKSSADAWKAAADAWWEEKKAACLGKWAGLSDSRVESWIQALPDYYHCYFKPVREAYYAKGFEEKVKRMYKELVKEDGDDKVKAKRRIHLVHSSKGGCGKTYTAITYAMYLAQKYAYGDNGETKLAGFDEEERGQNRVLLIDCDFRGAGVETQLLDTFVYPTHKEYKRNYSEIDQYKSTNIADRLVKHGRLVCTRKAPEYFNHCMMSNDVPFVDACISKMRLYRSMQPSDRRDQAAMKAHANLRESEELKIGFDVMFSDSGTDAKKAFLANSDHVDGSVVNCRYFKYCFGKMLRDLQNFHPEYTDIIIDMSPGIDEYVDCIMEECLSGDMATKNRVILHAVTTSDIAHIKAMEEYLENMITQRPLRQHEFKEIRLIVNEVRRYFWDGAFDKVDELGHRVQYGDPGGVKGTNNAEKVAYEIIKRMNGKVNNPQYWLEVYSQLFLEEYAFDNLSALGIDASGNILHNEHPLTDVYMTLCAGMDPDRELDFIKGSTESNRRFDLPLLFWELGDRSAPLNPMAPTRANA